MSGRFRGGIDCQAQIRAAMPQSLIYIASPENKDGTKDIRPGFWLIDGERPIVCLLRGDLFFLNSGGIVMFDIQIETEVVVTIIAVLVTVLLIASRRKPNALRRARLEYDNDLLGLAKDLKCNAGSFEHLVKPRFESDLEKKPHLITLGVLWGTLFWSALVVAYTWWAFFLLDQGFIRSAIMAGLFVLVALVMAVGVWYQRGQTNREINRLIHGVDGYEKELEQLQDKEAKRVEERPPAAEAKDLREVKAEPDAEKPLQIPQDSTLRRHFLTQLRADVEAELPPWPTDCTLQRHYEQMVGVGMEEKLGGPLPVEPQPSAPPQPIRMIEPRVRREVKAREEVKTRPEDEEERLLQVPEDSTLRRHFLTQLRAEIEARMPPAPIDASLRRHYDATVDAELGKRLVQGKA